MKNILLFMTDFYGYHKSIISELENQGYNVTWFLDKVELTPRERIIAKINHSYRNKKFDNYLNSCLDSVKDTDFEEILIVFGANYFKAKHIKLLKDIFHGIKIVYYAWDSVLNFPGIEDLFLTSDVSFTFDASLVCIN